jgi:hypothetical protein
MFDAINKVVIFGVQLLQDFAGGRAGDTVKI